MFSQKFKVKVSLGLLIACFLSFGMPLRSAKAEIIRNARPHLLYRLKRINATVVQRSVIGKNYIYAVQKVRQNSVIHRARKPRSGKNVVFPRKNKLVLKHFGHTQTWAYAGGGKWFIGCTPVKYRSLYWDTEIAQVSFPRRGTKTYSSAKQLPRLTDLRYATDLPQDEYKSAVKRSEAAVAPNHRWLLISSIDYDNNGHFAIYDLRDINRRLRAASHRRNKAVSLKDIKPLDAFHINNFFGPNAKKQVTSCQGFDIDNNKTLYVSGESAPSGRRSRFPRQVVKINWGETNPDNWVHYRVNSPSWKHQTTELESVEIANKNLRLTTSFHRLKPTPKVKRKRMKPRNIIWSSTESRIFTLPNIVG